MELVRQFVLFQPILILLLTRHAVCETAANTNETLTTNLTNPCHLDLDPGPCFGKFMKFYFHSADQKCKAFFFGGCYGNANQFQTVEECEFVCVDNDWPPYPIDNNGTNGGNETEPEPEKEVTSKHRYLDTTTEQYQIVEFNVCYYNHTELNNKI